MRLQFRKSSYIRENIIDEPLFLKTTVQITSLTNLTVQNLFLNTLSCHFRGTCFCQIGKVKILNLALHYLGILILPLKCD